MYLVITSYNGGVIWNTLLGVSRNMSEVFELVWNYSRYVKQVHNMTFQENHDEIILYKITEDDYNKIENMYWNYMEDIDKEFEKVNFEPDNVPATFWHIPYDGEGLVDCMFDDEDRQYIMDLVEKSVKVDLTK